MKRTPLLPASAWACGCVGWLPIRPRNRQARAHVCFSTQRKRQSCAAKTLSWSQAWSRPRAPSRLGSRATLAAGPKLDPPERCGAGKLPIRVSRALAPAPHRTRVSAAVRPAGRPELQPALQIRAAVAQSLVWAILDPEPARNAAGWRADRQPADGAPLAFGAIDHGFCARHGALSENYHHPGDNHLYWRCAF
jgi:hypothetical protein